MVLFILVFMTLPKDYVVEIFNIPLLYKHFTHHNEKHQKISVINFLKEHFTSPEKCPDNSEQNNNHTPIHQHSCSGDCFFTVHKIFSTGNNPSTYQLMQISAIKNGMYIFSLPPDVYTSIWQPPKI